VGVEEEDMVKKPNHTKELAKALRALAIETDRLTNALIEAGVDTRPFHVVRNNVAYCIGQAASTLAEYEKRNAEEVLIELRAEAKTHPVDLVAATLDKF
jgi:hypothetical protein